MESTKRAEELLARENLPSPRKPTHLLGKEYDFPTDPNTMSSMTLGRLKLELAALREWTRELLGKQEIYLHEIELDLSFMVPLAMLELIKTKEFSELPRAALVKEILHNAAIERNDLLKRLFHRSIEVRMVVERFRLQFEIYDGHYSALSREQSRREALARGGILD